MYSSISISTLGLVFESAIVAYRDNAYAKTRVKYGVVHDIKSVCDAILPRDATQSAVLP